MKITIYELLGLIKDGKVPKKIKHNNDIYEYEDCDYLCINSGYLFDRYNVSEILNDTVEILEEEKKIPEKMPEFIHSDSLNYMTCNRMFETLTNKYNDLIDYLKSKGDE